MLAGKLLAVVFVVKLVTSVPDQASNSHKEIDPTIDPGCDEGGCSQEKESHLLQKPELQANNTASKDDGSVKVRAAKDFSNKDKTKKCVKQGGRCVSRGTCSNGVTTTGCSKKNDCCITGTKKCRRPFKNIGNCCYYFSSWDSVAETTWGNSMKACKALGSDVSLAEVGHDKSGCNDVVFMEHVGQEGGKWFWFGGKFDSISGTFVWQRGGGFLSLNSNMWYYDRPAAYTNACVMSWPGNLESRAPRAYFFSNTCANVGYYVCQIF